MSVRKDLVKRAFRLSQEYRLLTKHLERAQNDHANDPSEVNKQRLILAEENYKTGKETLTTTINKMTTEEMERLQKFIEPL